MKILELFGGGLIKRLSLLNCDYLFGYLFIIFERNTKLISKIPQL